MKLNKRAILLIIVILLLLVVWKFSSNNNELKISQIDYDNIHNQIIGSELPRLLFADKEKVIFVSGGVYVYDLVNQRISLSMDTYSFMKKYIFNPKFRDIKGWEYALKDGNEIILSFINHDGEPYRKFYSFDISSETIKEISEENFFIKEAEKFQCEYLEGDNELYAKSTGMIANIDEKSFVYLTYADYKVNSIKIVLVEDGKETVFDVFSVS